jgi:hypothetical protein
MPKHNRASFAAKDRHDAKRGHPDFDLRAYAAERDLEFLDHATPAGFRAVLPGEAEWQHNVLRGTLPGGGHGILAHEGLPIDATGGDISWSWTFYFTRISTRGKLRIRDLFLWMLPFGEWLTSSGETPDVHAPCTTAAVRVPESAAPLTTLRIDRRRGAPPYEFGNREKLDDVGLPGWRMQAAPKPDPATVGRLLAAPVDQLLSAHAEDGLFQVVVWSATLLVRRNGYLRDPSELDELARAASLLGDRVREVCLPLADPQPFHAELPPPAWRDPQAPRDLTFDPIAMWERWALDTAAARRLELEDSRAYHRAFPSVPVPGLAYVVMRGELPGLGRGRLVVHRERNSARPAVLLAAPPGAAPTPPGGERDPDRAVVREVRDGLLSVWSTTSYWGDAMAGDLDDFLTRAAAVLS